MVSTKNKTGAGHTQALGMCSYQLPCTVRREASVPLIGHAYNLSCTVMEVTAPLYMYVQDCKHDKNL